jgi:arabinose-5-phosphate isomerase
VQPLRSFGAPLIGIVGNPNSALAGEVDIVLDACVPREADPGNFTPTASSAVALALGHALAVALMEARSFTHENFLHLHAGGQLGRNLSVTVREVMHERGEVAWVEPACPLRQVVIAMSRYPLGAACVIGADEGLEGLVTDGDLRRALEQHEDIRPLRAADVMTHAPVTVTADALVHDALSLMEDRPRQISVLPVVERGTRRCLGLIRLHDIYHSGAGID